jgi:predicted TPR repeat methyltransferase
MSAAQLGLHSAIAQHRVGNHAAAEAGYKEHLRQFPEDPSGLHFLGLLRSHQGRNAEAIELLTTALKADPNYVDAWSNLGIAHFQEHDLERAEMCCRKAIELSPEFANAWANLGMTLRARKSIEAALHAWSRALELDPRLRNVAISYGQLLYRLERNSEALDFYRRWGVACPEEPIPQHMLAAMGGSAPPARASDGYVKAIFDDFADSFDLSLQGLGYRAPELLHAALTGSGLDAPRATLEVIDLGCGTGLCGPLLRPLAKRLTGVDLSPKMLAKAAALGLYDQLNCAELTEYLASCGRHYDLALSADVLCYFGDLSMAFSRVFGALKAGGRFCCSLEAAENADLQGSYVLRTHGRYQHTRSYVETALAAAGFQGATISEGNLRYEHQHAVAGFVVVATRSDGPA